MKVFAKVLPFLALAIITAPSVLSLDDIDDDLFGNSLDGASFDSSFDGEGEVTMAPSEVFDDASVDSFDDDAEEASFDSLDGEKELTSTSIDSSLRGALSRLLNVDDGDTPGPDTQPPGGGAAPPPGTLQCFSAFMTVEVEGKGSVPMLELELGDKILTAGNVYSPVYAFGHREHDQVLEFIHFETKEGDDLEVTGGHLVYLEGHRYPVRSDAVQVGDVLKKAQGKAALITHITYVKRQGYYAPLTQEGTLLVNGMQASSYLAFQGPGSGELSTFHNGASTGFSQHMTAHVGLSPFRMVCLMTASKFCESYGEDGMPYYISYGFKLSNWTQEQSVIAQLCLYATLGLFCIFTYLMECIFGVYHALPVMFLVGMLVTLKTMMRLRPRKI